LVRPARGEGTAWEVNGRGAVPSLENKAEAKKSKGGTGITMTAGRKYRGPDKIYVLTLKEFRKAVACESRKITYQQGDTYRHGCAGHG